MDKAKGESEASHHKKFFAEENKRVGGPALNGNLFGPESIRNHTLFHLASCNFHA